MAGRPHIVPEALEPMPTNPFEPLKKNWLIEMTSRPPPGTQQRTAWTRRDSLRSFPICRYRHQRQTSAAETSPRNILHGPASAIKDHRRIY